MSYTLTQTNTNQGQINFLLVDVDQRVIWTLKAIVKVLKKATEHPPIAHHLRDIDIDLDELEKALEDAENHRRRIADISPPGCLPPPPPPLPPPPGGEPGDSRYTYEATQSPEGGTP